MNKLKEKLKKIERNLLFPIRYRKQRIRNKNYDFTIISDNCWAGRIYQELGLPYQTPFIGLFLFKDDYIKLLSNLKYYLSVELTPATKSKYLQQTKYPIGLLEDIEIHFLHYDSFEDAKTKWNKRKARINFNNLFIKMNDDDLFDIRHAQAFEKLPFAKKVFFSAQKYDLPSNVQIEKLSNKLTIKNGKDLKKYHQYFDVVNWLNEK